MANENESQELPENVEQSPEEEQQIIEQAAENPEGELPEFAKKRLGRQKKRYERELQEKEQLINELRSQMQNQPQAFDEQPNQSMQAHPNDVVSQIRQALAQEREEQQKALQQQEAMKNQQYLADQYKAFEDRLNDASEKYDDFDDVVRDKDAPFTEHMRDAALLLPNAGDVLYKLGKNRDELSRIAKLHPLDQAKEMIKLAFVSQDKKGHKSENNENSGTEIMEDVRGNPGSSNKNLQNASVSDLRSMFRK